MICKECARAADEQPIGKPRMTTLKHPTDCGCDCQHKPVKEGQIVESS